MSSKAPSKSNKPTAKAATKPAPAKAHQSNGKHLSTHVKTDDLAAAQKDLSKYAGAYETFLKLHELQARSRRCMLEFYYEVGVASSALYKKYNTEVTHPLAQHLGVTMGDLSKAVRFAAMYPREEFKRMVASDRISWSHMRLLVGMDDSKRKNLEKKLVNSPKKVGWRELQEMVQAAQGGNRNHAAKPGAVKSVIKQVAKMTGMTEKWTFQYDNVWQASLLSQLDTVNTDSMEELEKAKVSLEAAKERIEKALERFSETIVAVQNQAAAAAHNAEAENDLEEMAQAEDRNEVEADSTPAPSPRSRPISASMRPRSREAVGV